MLERMYSMSCKKVADVPSPVDWTSGEITPIWTDGRRSLTKNRVGAPDAEKKDQDVLDGKRRVGRFSAVSGQIRVWVPCGVERPERPRQ